MEKEFIEMRDCCNSFDDNNHLEDCPRMAALDLSYRKDAQRRIDSPTAGSLHARALAGGNGHSWLVSKERVQRSLDNDTLV